MKTKTDNAVTDRQHRDPLLIDQAFEKYPEDVSQALMDIRELIFETHAQEPRAGELSEVLRWGQLSFLTDKPKTGSMLRLGLAKCGRPALFCHCGTTLIADFEDKFGELFDYEVKRALVIKHSLDECRDALQECVLHALTYKLT